MFCACVREDQFGFFVTRSLHFSQINYVPRLGAWVDLDNADGGANPQCAVENINAQDYGVSFAKRGDNLQATGPHSLWRSISPFGFHYLVVVSGECIEQVIDDIGCTIVSRSISDMA